MMTFDSIRLSEANIQAEFYFWAKTLGLPCLLELSTPKGRLDVAIFNSTKTQLLAIVECKRDGCQLNEHSRQMVRYRKIGVPIYGLFLPSEAEGLARKIQNELVLTNKSGLSVEDLFELEREKRSKPLPRRNRRIKFVELDEDLIIRH